MKTAIALAGSIVLAAGMALDCCAQEKPDFWQSIKNPATLAQLKSFVAAKEAQANAVTNKMPEEFKTFFAAADKGDWLAVSNMFYNVGERNGHFWSTNEPDCELHGIPWFTLQEIWGAFAAFEKGDEKYSVMFGSDIIQSIPPGSIYLGGTDPGRFIITAVQKSQIQADPFFTLTQNALTDEAYLDYLRSMYGKEIYIPTPEDFQKCFDDFYADVKKRYKKNQLKLGEDVTVNSNGVLQVSGLIAVNEINAMLVKLIFDKETNRDFYVEEDMPMDWMYPYLEPHGLIFKLNHQPLRELPNDKVRADHDCWTNVVASVIGDWLDDDTTVATAAMFTEKVSLRHDFNGFKGDRDFVMSPYSRYSFSKERLSIADLYTWRAKHAADAIEKQRMNREADFAFRQAWVLWPKSPEVVFRYVQFLMDASRADDAIIVTKTCLELAPDNDSISDLLKNLEKYKKQCDDWASYQTRVSAMEQEVHTHPSDYTNIYWLADSYLYMLQTNRAVELWKQTISRSNIPDSVLYRAGDYFAQINDFTNLETILTKLAVVGPGLPETWYDLARVDAHLGKNEEAIKNLGTAIDLSDQRLKTKPKALNIRDYVRTNTIDFIPIRNTPEFQKLVTP